VSPDSPGAPILAYRYGADHGFNKVFGLVIASSPAKDRLQSSDPRSVPNPVNARIINPTMAGLSISAAPDRRPFREPSIDQAAAL